MNNRFDVVNPDGFLEHCRVAALIIGMMPINPHTKHHIRGAIREATLKVTKRKGGGKKSAAYMSKEALLVYKNEGYKTGKLVLEHSVPVSVLNSWILELKYPTYLDIANIVYQWTELALITKEEHNRLSEISLAMRMPDDWDNLDKFARYKKADIELVDTCL